MKKILTPKVIDSIIIFIGIGISTFLATKADGYLIRFGETLSTIGLFSLMLNGIILTSSIVVIRKLRRAGISWKKLQDL